MRTRIVSTAPSRIDLAGGTLDIYPIYLMEGDAYTVNAAITLGSRVVVETEACQGVRVVSEDLGEEVAAPSAQGLPLNGQLDLLIRAVQYYGVPDGTVITARNLPPPGSGLGASSSLLIAVVSALCELHGLHPDVKELVDIAFDLETQNLCYPAGKQDYYAAACGGINAIWFGPGGPRLERLGPGADLAKALKARTLLVYTGKSRASACVNWDMLRNYVEDRGDSRARIRRIREVAFEMKRALQEHDIDEVARLLGEEWEARRGLADTVTNEESERIMAAAMGAGATACKFCGAGGGGCMVIMAAPDRLPAVAEAATQAGGTVLDFDFSLEGVTVRRGN
ncbi:MAG: hypothetical protein N2512_02815 [Armatimonadetes bacterium]|nr:hypothetical protein [Armatimonadota bacterium]